MEDETVTVPSKEYHLVYKCRVRHSPEAPRRIGSHTELRWPSVIVIDQLAKGVGLEARRRLRVPSSSSAAVDVAAVAAMVDVAAAAGHDEQPVPLVPPAPVWSPKSSACTLDQNSTNIVRTAARYAAPPLGHTWLAPRRSRVRARNPSDPRSHPNF
jgi:hypothetical protein